MKLVRFQPNMERTHASAPPEILSANRRVEGTHLPCMIIAQHNSTGCKNESQRLRRYAHVDPVKPTRAGERAAIFFPFLHVAVSVGSADHKRVITHGGRGPLCSPE